MFGEGRRGWTLDGGDSLAGVEGVVGNAGAGGWTCHLGLDGVMVMSDGWPVLWAD